MCRRVKPMNVRMHSVSSNFHFPAVCGGGRQASKATLATGVVSNWRVLGIQVPKNNFIRASRFIAGETPFRSLKGLSICLHRWGSRTEREPLANAMQCRAVGFPLPHTQKRKLIAQNRTVLFAQVSPCASADSLCHQLNCTAGSLLRDRDG